MKGKTQLLIPLRADWDINAHINSSDLFFQASLRRAQVNEYESCWLVTDKLAWPLTSEVDHYQGTDYPEVLSFVPLNTAANVMFRTEIITLNILIH